jgi:hypothetical protein
MGPPCTVPTGGPGLRYLLAVFAVLVAALAIAQGAAAFSTPKAVFSGLAQPAETATMRTTAIINRGTATSPFAGTWQNIDSPGDGSHLTLTIIGSANAVGLLMHDDYATLCVKAGATSSAANIPGTGTIQGTTLTYVVTEVQCAGGLTLPGGAPQTLVYDATSDTLTDGGLASPWSRVPPSAPPVPPKFVLTPTGVPTAGRRFGVSVSVNLGHGAAAPPDTLTCTAKAGTIPVKTAVVRTPGKETCTLTIPKGSNGKTLTMLLKPTHKSTSASKTLSSTIR